MSLATALASRSRIVPIAFVDGDHFAGVASDAAVGEEVGRVGEDEVDGIFWDGGEDFETVALVEAEVVLGVVESGGGENRGCGIHAGQIGNKIFLQGLKPLLRVALCRS